MNQKGIAHLILLIIILIIFLMVFGAFLVYPRVKIEMGLKTFYYPRAQTIRAERIVTERKVNITNPTTQTCSFSNNIVSFMCSWGTPIESKNNIGAITIKFANNLTMNVSYKPASQLLSVDEFNENSGQKLAEMDDDLKKGKEPGYDLKRQLLAVQPSDIKIYTLPAEANKIYNQLIIKIVQDYYLVKGNIYHFDNGTVKGFQAGNPGIDKAIFLDIYNNKGDLTDINLLGQSVTQDEIDALITSFSSK